MKPVRLLALLLTLAACQAEEVYLYEVNPVEVTQPGADKVNQKSDLEFLSLAYSDLFGSTIPANELNRMVIAYESMGDKALVADMIIRNLLNSPGVQIPSGSSMRANPDQFITDTYRKFFIREPGEYERWYLRQLITEDPDMTPEMIYYAFLTSAEYRYY